MTQEYLQEEYIGLLSSMDWNYEYTDDYSVYCKYKAQHELILAYSQEVDKDFSIYNRFRNAHI